ncbi:MAG: hypothetical protein ACRC4K_15290 [Plesiomonas shigelloides]
MCAAQQHADNLKTQELKSPQPRAKQENAEESAANKNEQDKKTGTQESIKCMSAGFDIADEVKK